MSRTDPTPGQWWVLEVPCIECDAAVGDWCRSNVGEFAHKLHSTRWTVAGQCQADRARRAMDSLEGLIMI